MSHYDTGLQIDESEKELADALQKQYDINKQISDRRVAVLRLNLEIKELSQQQDAYDLLVKQIRLRISGLTRLFWKEKQGNV
jgi:predicted phage tail protein